MKKFILFLILVFSNQIYSIDIIKFESGQSENDVRMQYKLEVLEEAMKHTIEQYGDYQILTNAPKMNSFRALTEIKKGTTLNTYIALTDNEWETNTIPIRIPIRRGILNYRILMTHKDDLHLFENIYTASDLKELIVGMQFDWTSTKVMKSLQFNIVESHEYDSLFQMLNGHRFNFIIRGINEVYKEYNQLKDKLPNITVEPNLLISMPSPTYIFVSPKHPELAKRLKTGLELMIKNGELKRIFDKYYKSAIIQADLKNRRLIELGNPLLPTKIPFDRQELWVDLLNY